MNPDDLLSSTPGTTGVLVVDSTGLAVACRGDLTASQSGFVRGLSAKASSLGKKSEEPVVVLRTETRYGVRAAFAPLSLFRSLAPPPSLPPQNL